MGKKRCRKTKRSKGIHTSVGKIATTTAHIDKMLNKIDAWKAGKNPWITIDNVNGPSDQKHIRVRANKCWGDPRGRFNIYLKKEKNASRLQQE